MASVQNFLRLLRPRFQQGVRRDGAASTGLTDRRVFAFGDIHGCVNLLDAAMHAVEAATSKDPHPPVLIFLGDYVDRGPSSKDVIQRLIEIKRVHASSRFIAGNHEEAMVNFLDHPFDNMAWMRFGGAETIESYGLVRPSLDLDLGGWGKIHTELCRAVPKAHRRFLWGLENFVEIGDYFFVHAGVDPAVPLSQQNPRDLRWIRSAFLSHGKPLEKVIVHGHTPFARPRSNDIRVSIDTGAYRSGRLTFVELFGAKRRFFEVLDRQAETSVNVVEPE